MPLKQASAVCRARITVEKLDLSFQAQLLFDDVDDLRDGLLPLEGRTDSDPHHVDVEADTGHALDLVERQRRLDCRRGVVVHPELRESIGSGQRVVQLLRGDTAVDMEVLDGLVRERLDDDTWSRHFCTFS